MNDYRVIAFAHHAERLTADHTRSLHREAKRWLWSAARTAFDGPAVVVTHHAPHPKSVAPQFEDVPLTAAYVSDMTATIQAVDPVLWIHGHVHDCFDYQVGATRVLCNPKGYSDENSRFNPSLVVEV